MGRLHSVMPELPEVERARRLVIEHCAGRQITHANVLEQGGGPRDGLFDDIVQCDLEPDQLSAALLGRTLSTVHRRGKQMWFELTGPGMQPLFHFGMTGSFSIQGIESMQYKSFSVTQHIWPPKFCKLEIVFSGDVRLAFSDPRRLGRIVWRANPVEEPPISLLAPDPVLAPLTADDFCTKLSSTIAPIKAVLLDQNRVVSGVGNWIADEVLYQSALHPSNPSSSLSCEQMRTLHHQLCVVCGTACDVNADSSRFPKTWLFHYRWGKGKEPVKMPDGNPITFETVAGRTSAVVLAVQKKQAGSSAKGKKPAVKRAVAAEEEAKPAKKKRGDVKPAKKKPTRVSPKKTASPEKTASTSTARKTRNSTRTSKRGNGDETAVISSHVK